LHLDWDVPDAPADDPWVAAEAVLEVRSPPEVLALYFWALQASFTDQGRHGGAGHLGLQWYPAHPGSTAVNWGGYGADGRELDGSISSLPSATGNPNTRDFRWHARPRRTGSASSGPRRGMVAGRGRGSVTGAITGTETVVRLWAPGVGLTRLVVWSEVLRRAARPAPRSTGVTWA
jgi:hypothetical protein